MARWNWFKHNSFGNFRIPLSEREVVGMDHPRLFKERDTQEITYLGNQEED